MLVDFYNNGGCIVFGSFLPWTGSRRHCRLKSHLILVNFNFFKDQFQIKWARFSMVFPTYAQFCTKIVVLLFFKDFSAANFLAELKKLAHKNSSSLSTVFQFTNNWSNSTIDESFNIFRTKSLFSINHQTIEPSFDRSTY